MNYNSEPKGMTGPSGNFYFRDISSKKILNVNLNIEIPNDVSSTKF